MTPSKIAYKTLFWIALSFFIFVMFFLPASIKSIIDNAKYPGREAFVISQPAKFDKNYTILKLKLTSFDEANQKANFNVSGQHVCRTECGAYTQRVRFFAITLDDASSNDIPTGYSLSFPNVTDEISQNFSLSMGGDIFFYPFDKYQLGLGITFDILAADKSELPITIEQANNRFQLHFAEESTKIAMSSFKKIAPQSIKPIDANFDYLFAFTSEYERPVYLKVVVSIVVLITALVSIYLAITQPFDKLVIGSASVTIGIFGSRSLLLANVPADVTLIDTLFLIIVTLNLVALIFVGMNFYHKKADLKILPWAKASSPVDEIQDVTSESRKQS